MPPIPSNCQQFANQLATLTQQYEELAVTAKGTVGAEAWTRLAELGQLRRQVEEARAELDRCTQTYAAALTGTLTVLDASGKPPLDGAQTATLWDITGSGAVARAQAQVQAGAFGFEGPLPAQAAITIQTGGASDTNITGVDFRSGPLPDPLAGQVPHIEVVVGPELSVPASRLAGWAGSFAAVTQRLTSPAQQLDLGFTVSSIMAAPSAGSLRVAVAGSISGTSGGGLVTLPLTPVSATVVLSLQPSAAPQADDAVSVAIVDHVDVQASGSLLGFAQLFGAIAGLVQAFTGDMIQHAFSDWLHQVLPSFLAESLALPALPVGTAVSLRRLTVDEQGIHLQPVLGAIGTVLSTFQPVLLPPP